ncbi:MAG: DUF72 domain-containing protein, partial [Candidatus Sumerlaeia bacterium]|nr:DUF72 domain-containing protein [Candidatus Sumerlaeia bacterium]
MSGIKIGCCGFPEARTKYYQEFSVVEVQQTFYELPRLATAEKWRAEAPPEFEWTMKAWQLITHPAHSPTYRRLKTRLKEASKKYYGFFQPTMEVMEAWERTREFAQKLKAKIVIFQCPASFTPTAQNLSNLRKFFTQIERTGLICVWEPRGNWDASLTQELCKELQLVHCVDPFKADSTAGEIVYYRLHGITGYRYKYTAEELQQLRDKIKTECINYVL